MCQRRLAPLCSILALLWTLSAIAQVDKGEVNNVTYMSSGCTMDMTPYCGAADVYLSKFPLISGCRAVRECYTLPDAGTVCYAFCKGDPCYVV